MLNQLTYTTSACTLLNDNVLMPQAWIAINKNRTKHYDKEIVFYNEKKKVFLANNTEFQIELFNPTQDVFLAKIKFNGKDTNNSGIVLFPGQRIYLDRYLNKDNKLKFTTYYVSNDSVSKKAIENNGIVDISFYKEQTIALQPLIYNNFYSQKLNLCDWTTTNISTNPIGEKGTIGSQGTNGISGNIGNDISQNCYCYSSINPQYSNFVTCANNIETGRISEGSLSSQKFVNIDKEFSNIISKKITIKLLPESQKACTLDDIMRHRKYCSNCGKKVSPKDKYCSNCGKKL